jgi:hypothetical protein
METSTSVHASDVDPDTLRQMLAEQAAYEQAKVFRNLLLRRLGLIALVVWVLSWPAHLLPHIALWVALAIVALAVVLTAPPPQSTA